MSESPGAATLIWQQIRNQNRVFWRTPIAAFFTLAFPLMFLVLFTAIFGNEVNSNGITTAQFFAPNLAVFAAVSASYTNLAIGTAMARDEGILKRMRGTPLPPWIYIAGRIGSATYIAAIAVVLMMAVGVIAYGVQVSWESLPASILAFFLGVGCFSALGMFVAAVVPSDATPAVTNATLLPLAFLSDMFFIIENPPRWMEMIGNFFPLKHFAIAFREPLNPAVEGLQFEWGHLAYVALWGVVAVVAAARFFRWEQRPDKSRRQARADA